jgi:hypothetical protein
MSRRNFVVSLASGLRERHMRAKRAAKIEREPLLEPKLHTAPGEEKLQGGQMHSEQNSTPSDLFVGSVEIK